MNDELRLSRIGVLMLGVKDMARSVEFYRDLLGMTLQNQFPGLAFFDGGGVTLALSEALAKASAQAAGAIEVVFSVDSVRGAWTALQKKGVTFTHEPRNVTGSKWAANFNDPDGHKLSVFGPEFRESAD